MTSYPTDLDCVDDICLITQLYDDSVKQTFTLARKAKEYGLSANIKKTKSMCINIKTNKPFTVDASIVAKIDEFIYLVSVITKIGGYPQIF